MRTLSLHALRGRHVVLVHAEGWRLHTEPAEVIDAIRAELRGLGAVLVVRGGGAAWCFRPDDDPERLAEGGDVAGLDEETNRAALVVLDPDGAVRFSRTLAPVRGLGASLADALSTAGRTLAVERRAPALSRREWLTASLVAGFALAFLDACAAHEKPAVGVTAPQGIADSTAASNDVDVVLHVDGTEHRLPIDPRVSLLDALRERLGLTGTKKGCDHGQCGACTVLVDGRRVNACLVLAVMAQGAKITTIDGLAKGGALHPVQAAFVAEDALQCGYCTPGQIMSAVALLDEGHAGSDDEVREWMSGNLCRCGAYPNIVRAIRRARGA